MDLIIVMTFSLFGSVLAGKCNPSLHYWRPYFGEVTKDSFVAGIDQLGIKSYIGKIIPMTRDRSWTQPTQLIYDYAEFAWEDLKVRRIDDFIEKMVVDSEHRDRFQWLSVSSMIDLKDIIERTCLVEGGIVEYNDTIVIAYIGRATVQSSVFIGPVYLNRWVMRAGMHYMVGWNKKLRQQHYEVLSYRPLPAKRSNLSKT